MKPSANNPWAVRNKFRGTLTNKSEAIVMDNSRDRDNPNKVVVNYFITENISLLAGNNTVAVFRLKKQADIFTDDTIILDELQPGEAFRTSEHGQLLVKHDNVSIDGKITAINPFGDVIHVSDDQIVIVPKKENSLNSTNLFTAYLNKQKATAVNSGS